MHKERKYCQMGVLLFSIFYLSFYQEVVQADQNSIESEMTQSQQNVMSITLDVEAEEKTAKEETLPITEADSSVSVKDVQVIGQVILFENQNLTVLKLFDEL